MVYDFGTINILIFFVQGTYTIALKIVSYQGDPHPLFACLNFTVQIV